LTIFDLLDTVNFDIMSTATVRAGRQFKTATGSDPSLGLPGFASFPGRPFYFAIRYGYTFDR
jgi:hypothetical protein